MTDTKDADKEATSAAVRDEMEGVRQELERLKSNLDRTAFSGNSTIQINAGGLGVWIATACAAVMLGIGIVGGWVMIDQNRKIGELQAYLSAIYAQAPYLKPEEDQ